MYELIILAITSLFNSLLGLVVFIKNPTSTTNRNFLLLTNTFAAWSIVNYLSTNPVLFSQLTWIRLVLFFGALLNLALFLNFITFPSGQISRQLHKYIKFAIIGTAIIMPLTLTPLVFKSLEVTSSGSSQPIPNFGIVLFGLHTLILIGASLVSVIRKYISSKGVVRSQLGLILLGITGTFGLILLSNFVAVVVFHNSSFIPLGPAFTILFSSTFAYAIVKHKLFDVRAAIARTVGYILSLTFIALVYGVVIFILLAPLLSSQMISGKLEHALFTGLALVSAMIFPITKKYFDQLTKKLFYQDAYDSEEFLGEINKLLVGQIELEQLLKGITDVIEANLKSMYCVFVVRETAYEDVRIVGSEHHQFDVKMIQTLRELTPHTHKKVLLLDEIQNDQTQLKEILQNLDISALIRLVSNVSLDLEGMGYLVLGPKKNGAIYSSQDKKVLNILANEMIIAIENALRFEEIEKFNITLQEKVDAATSELKRTNEKLKEMDETKDEFISMASHQLRTPLTSVKGYLSMVLEGDVGKVNKQQNRMLEQAYLSSQRMVYLIADLLNVSRLKTGKFVIDVKDTNLADVAETEVEQLQPTAKARDLDLVFIKPKDFPIVTMDETKIRQVLMNFIDNAIYYTPAGGKITVTLEDKGETIEYKVHDTGIGVPKAERHNLFSKFYRAGNARKARPDGTGLGLFMAKKVVVAQGGAIIFETEEGKGSTFGFSFAKEKLAKLAEESKEADEK